MLQPQLERNSWLSIASSDSKFETSGANIEIVTEIIQRLTQENLETDASGHEATPVTRKI